MRFIFIDSKYEMHYSFDWEGFIFPDKREEPTRLGDPVG
jgi:hypothetical protein